MTLRVGINQKAVGGAQEVDVQLDIGRQVLWRLEDSRQKLPRGLGLDILEVSDGVDVEGLMEESTM